jgi:hypothetical protein
VAEAHRALDRCRMQYRTVAVAAAATVDDQRPDAEQPQIGLLGHAIEHLCRGAPHRLVGGGQTGGLEVRADLHLGPGVGGQPDPGPLVDGVARQRGQRRQHCCRE